MTIENFIKIVLRSHHYALIEIKTSTPHEFNTTGIQDRFHLVKIERLVQNRTQRFRSFKVLMADAMGPEPYRAETSCSRSSRIVLIT
jgi:hypothetical protein